MSNETNRASGRSLERMFDAGQIRFDPERPFQTSMTGCLSYRTDLDGSDTAREIAVLVGGLGRPADAFERAVQALRDVRHLLSPEGVAIVDAILDGC